MNLGGFRIQRAPRLAAMACVDGRPAEQARAVADRALCGHVLRGLTAIVVVGLPTMPWQGVALCIHPDCLQIMVGNLLVVAGCAEPVRGSRLI